MQRPRRQGGTLGPVGWVPRSDLLPMVCGASARRLAALDRHTQPRRGEPAAPPAPLATPLGSSGVGEEVGLEAAGVATAHAYLAGLVEAGTTSGACLAVSRHGRRLPVHACGRSGPVSTPSITHGLQGGMELAPDSIFASASITKPVTSAAALLLVQEGRLGLLDRVADHLPAFADGGQKDGVRVWQLLCHVSGLPDSWPGNHPLRSRAAPLADYTREQLQVPLLFPPGTNVSYSSTAIDLAAAIVERIAEMPLPVFLHQRLFEPLGMGDTSLGHGEGYGWSRQKSREVCLNLEPGRFNRAGRTVGGAKELPLGSLSFGNSDYWRELGCPSGGMSTTAADLLCLMEGFCQRAAGEGSAAWAAPTALPLTAETVRRMVTPHTEAATAAGGMAEGGLLDDGAWGLGWRVSHATGVPVLGTTATAFGAHGSTGCMAWADPRSGLCVVLLTPEPDLCYSAEFNHLSDLLQRAVIQP